MSTIISRVFYVLWLTSLLVNLNNGDENNPSQFDDGKYRLPDTIIPTSYELKIVPNLKDAFDFSGEVTITVKAAETTNEVVLHCYGLNLTAISISNETEKINQDKREYLEEEQFLKLKTKSELLKNAEYTIHALFRGSLKDEPIGFYKECYKQGKDIKWLATTQLEPIHARTVFPCFDEPRYKTPFLIHIARSESQMSVANMPYVMSKGPEVKIQNRTWDIFESKQSISTYQVAFTVTEYFFKPDVDIGVVLGTPNNRGNKNIFDILTKSKVILKELESYTKRNFTKENMHMVAISDFLVGALENSGLSTIKESMAIHSRSKTSKLSKEVTELAAVHEFAHQWFGDYVTPAWWNHTWLKEAFATFMEYKILNKIEPKWKMEELFITDILQQALLQDKHSHPMTMQVRTPSEITGIYDFVTYQKGASILKMLEFMISPSIFKRGVQRYLKIGSNKTIVTPDDLWDAMNEQVIKDRLKLPKTIKDIMEPWTLNAGYPLITVEIENEDVIIKQESYDKNAGHNVTWTVPITYGTQSDDLEITTPMEWLNPFEQLVLDNAVKPGQWLILNLGQSGYYRVNYDYNNWQALTEQLNKDFKAIPPVNRAKLIDDALNLAMDQRLNYNTALSLLGYFPKENDYLPQISVLYNLKNLFLKFEQTTIESSLKIFISKLIIKLYNRLGMSNGFFDNDITKRIRKDAVYLACKVDITKCQQSASSLFSKNEKHLEKIDENLKPAVFCSAFDQLDEEIVFRFILEFYNKSNSALDREIVINSFACLKNTSLIKNILAKNVTILRKRDLQKAIEIILRSGKNPLAITEYIRSVLSAINGNIIPKNTENELRYIIRNIKIVNVGQLKALNNLLHQVKELERFHSILNELVERSQNSNVFIRDTERAAREVNETIYEMFSSENKSRRFEFLMQPLKFMSNQFKNVLQKGENIFAKLRNSKNYIEPYFTIKIKNLFNYMSNIFHSSPKTIESSTSTITTKESNVGVSGITNEI